MEAHAQPEEPTQRDNTDEWRLAPARSLTSVAELEGRIDVAVATARAAEEAALEIGAASLEAAEQARRAAALAERASISAAQAAESARGGAGAAAPTADDGFESGPAVSVVEPEPEPIARVAGEPTEDAEPETSPVEPEAPPAASEAPPVARPPMATPSANGLAAGSHRDPDPFEDRITAFKLRAEKVMIRLQKIEAGAPPHQPTEVLRLR